MIFDEYLNMRQLFVFPLFIFFSIFGFTQKDSTNIEIKAKKEYTDTLFINTESINLMFVKQVRQNSHFIAVKSLNIIRIPDVLQDQFDRYGGSSVSGYINFEFDESCKVLDMVLLKPTQFKEFDNLIIKICEEMKHEIKKQNRFDFFESECPKMIIPIKIRRK